MSQLLQVATRVLGTNGGIFAIPSQLPPAYVDQGIPFDFNVTEKSVSIDLTSPIAYYEMGLPFTAEGRIAAEEAPPVRYNSGSMPITASDRLAVSTAPVDFWTTGIPYVANGAVCIELQSAFLGVTITQQPQNISVIEGDPAVFTVLAVSGDASPMSYQWQQFIVGVWTNLTNVPPFTGTTTATLTIDPAELVDTGDQFRVIVTNNFGPTTSAVATLTVTAFESFYIIAENGDFCVTEDGLDNMVTELAA